MNEYRIDEILPANCNGSCPCHCSVNSIVIVELDGSIMREVKAPGYITVIIKQYDVPFDVGDNAIYHHDGESWIEQQWGAPLI